MRTPLLMLIAAVGLVACATVQPPAKSATAAPAAAAGSTQPAVWMPRKLHVMVLGAACDRVYNIVKWSLLRLGARASDLHVEEPADECHHGPDHEVGIEATFSVLAPIDSAAGAEVEAHWQSVELIPRGYSFNGRRAGGGTHIAGGGLGGAPLCYLPELVEQQIVPSFFTIEAKVTDDCNLRVQALTAAPVPGLQYLLNLERE
jgi:hypothetical protein